MIKLRGAKLLTMPPRSRSRSKSTGRSATTTTKVKVIADDKPSQTKLGVIGVIRCETYQLTTRRRRYRPWSLSSISDRVQLNSRTICALIRDSRNLTNYDSQQLHRPVDPLLPRQRVRYPQIRQDRVRFPMVRLAYPRPPLQLRQVLRHQREHDALCVGYEFVGFERR